MNLIIRPSPLPLILTLNEITIMLIIIIILLDTVVVSTVIVLIRTNIVRAVGVVELNPCIVYQCQFRAYVVEGLFRLRNMSCLQLLISASTPSSETRQPFK